MIIGIDLGTTNSEVAVWKDGKVKILEHDGTPIMPSCVGLSSDGELVIGRKALNQYALRPEDTVRSVKRKMGSKETITLGGEEYRAPEVSAMILRELKRRAEKELGENVSQAVITVPAYFNDAQRQATREAGDLAGLEVLRILNEPTAAGLAFEAEGVEGTKQVMVFDLGGGTFDVSILKMSGDVVEVLASHGDNHLGGDDIDELLHEHMIASFYEEHPGSDALNSASMNRMKLACEVLKKELSMAAAASLAETGLILEKGGIADFSHEMTQSDFDSICDELLRRTLGSVRHVLAQAGLKAEELDDVLLVGGSTRIPKVLDMLEEELGLRPRCDIHPDLAVVYGAGVMAARLSGERNMRILVDVTPYTFGTRALGMLNGECVNELFVPLIKSGTPLPARRGKVFHTTFQGQDRVHVEIYQGDAPNIHDNVFVGEFLVEELDETAEEASPIMINMHLDLDGILQVTAIEQHTGLSKSVVLDDVLGASDEATLTASRKKIRRLMGDNDKVPTEKSDKKRSAFDLLLEKVNQKRGEMEPEDCEDLDAALADLREAEANGNEEDANTARETIEDIFFFLEGN